MSKEFKTYSMDIAGKTLRVDIGRVAAQANGAAFMHYGDTTVLSTITASEKPRDGIDFFPLSVEYEEKMYAVDSTREREKHLRTQYLHPVLSTVRCVRYSLRIIEMMLH